MAIDPASPRSRRAVLAAALGGLAASAAAALGRPLPARAAAYSLQAEEVNVTTAGTTIQGGYFNTLTVSAFGAGASAIYATATSNANAITASADAYDALYGQATTGTGVYGSSNSGFGVDGFCNTGVAVRGMSNSATGVYGQSNSATGVGVRGHSNSTSGSTFGVYGTAKSTGGTAVWGDATALTGAARGVLGTSLSITGAGVQGYSGTAPVPTPSPKTGVYGYAAQDGTAVGVKGESTAGTGLSGVATTGVGVRAASAGTALQVAGKAQFSRCGRASVPKNRTYVDITVAGGLAANSIVNATLQTYRSGVGIAAVRANYPVAGKARIYLTKVASTTAATSVGWFVAEY